MQGLCIRCFVPLSFLNPSQITYIACCSKPVCDGCVAHLKACPICRVRVDPAALTGAPGGQPASSHTESSPLLAGGDNSPAPPPYQEQEEDRVATPPPPIEACQVRPPARAEIWVGEDGALRLRHYISPRDTLVGLSLRYGVSAQEIKRANRLFSDNINERESLLIPGVQELPEDLESLPQEVVEARERQRVLKRFQLTTKCSDMHETRFYLESADYDIDRALAMHAEDVAWEAEHGGPPPRRSAAAASKRAPSMPLRYNLLLICAPCTTMAY